MQLWWWWWWLRPTTDLGKPFFDSGFIKKIDEANKATNKRAHFRTYGTSTTYHPPIAFEHRQDSRRIMAASAALLALFSGAVSSSNWTILMNHESIGRSI